MDNESSGLAADAGAGRVAQAERSARFKVEPATVFSVSLLSQNAKIMSEPHDCADYMHGSTSSLTRALAACRPARSKNPHDDVELLCIQDASHMESTYPRNAGFRAGDILDDDGAVDDSGGRPAHTLVHFAVGRVA
jgi:hypothetical protein